MGFKLENTVVTKDQFEVFKKVFKETGHYKRNLEELELAIDDFADELMTDFLEVADFYRQELIKELNIIDEEE